MLARCIARRIVRARTARALTRNLYGFAPGDRQTFEDSGLPPLYQASTTSEEQARNGRELKHQLTAEADYNEPELDEEGLLRFYRDMVYSGSEGIIEDTPESLDVNRRITGSERRRMISSMVARLEGLTVEDPVTGLGIEAEKRTAASTSQQSSGSIGQAGPSRIDLSLSQYTNPRPSSRVLDLLARLQIPRSFDTKGKEKETEHGRPMLPLGLLTVKEWQALFDDAMSSKDHTAAERVLSQMSQHGFPIVNAWVEKLVTAYARAGDVAAVDRLNVNMAQVFADAADYQAAGIIAVLNRFGQAKAISILKHHERQGVPLAQKAYQVVLEHLGVGSRVFRPDSHSRALARDLFAHMRLVAHPHPERGVYRAMILNCAAPLDPQPERARDLWLEMTTEADAPALQPEKEDYNAIIRALCTSKDDYLEGFDIFRQMLSKHQDAIRIPFDDTPRATWSKFIPTLKTFSALLQGTKRVGDLERTRWLLLEMVKLVQAASMQTDVEVKGPDASVLADVFHAYATWHPSPTQPIKTRDGSEASDHSDSVDIANTYGGVDMTRLETRSGHAINQGTDPGPTDQYSPSPLPRSHAEALREASAIWDRLLYDVKAARMGQANLVEYPFSQVWLDHRVIVAYQSVILHHTWDVSKAKELWTQAYKDANEARGVARTGTNQTQDITVRDDHPQAPSKTLNPNGWSYTEALDFCAYARKSHQHSAEVQQSGKWDRAAAHAWAKELWSGYIQLLNSAAPIRSLARGGEESATATQGPNAQPENLASASEARAWLYNFGLGDRQIERAFKAMIRAQVIGGDPLGGLNILCDFRDRFPRNDILLSYRPILPSGLSMSVEDPTSLAEPNVPPALTWNDLSILHEGLVKGLREATSDDEARPYEQGLKTVKNLCKSYESALHTRRRWRIKRQQPSRPATSRVAEKQRVSTQGLASHRLPDVYGLNEDQSVQAPKGRIMSDPAARMTPSRDMETDEVARLVALQPKLYPNKRSSKPKFRAMKERRSAKISGSQQTSVSASS